MKKLHSKIIVLFAVLLLFAACSTVPITERRQIKLIPNATMFATSFQQYTEFLDSNKVSNNATQANLVKKVGVNIQKAVEKYFADKGQSAILKDYKWEFNLVEDKQVNAWCMPNG